MTPHPIEEESYRILGERIDLSHLDPGPRAVIERIIHASADLEYATTMHVEASAVATGTRALEGAAPVIVDVEMVAAGITGRPAECYLRDATAGPGGFPTRSAAAVRAAAARHPDGAIWVIGCAPTALTEVIALVDAGRLQPALVIALPVGFVGAADSKRAAVAMEARTGVPVIANTGEKGGSAVAAAAFNALVHLTGSGGSAPGR